jgi:hypothetical protein
VLPTETWGIFLGIDIGGGYKALLVSPERTTLPLFPAAQRQLRQGGNPSLSNLAVCCMVAVDGDLLCVLAKCNELVTDSIRKSCMIFFEMVGNCTCLHDTREALVLNLHLFCLVGVTDFTHYY